MYTYTQRVSMMLISALDVRRAMSLFTEDLVIALAANGYEGEKFIGSYFEGMNESGQFVYAVSFVDHDGVECSGRVFLSYKEVRPGYVQLVGDY